MTYINIKLFFDTGLTNYITNNDSLVEILSTILFEPECYFKIPFLIINLSHVVIADIAKSEKAPEDMTVYAALESPINLTVTFHINPVSNYTVHWFNGSSTLDDTKIINTVKEEHVQTTYSISEMTKEQLRKTILFKPLIRP